MRVLVAEDDIVSRKFLCKFLSRYGECDQAVDGMEAIDAYIVAIKDQKPYDLICLDIMMPKVDGIKALKTIRDLEKQNNIPKDKRVKVIVTTALAETTCVKNAFSLGCEAYAPKPIDTRKLTEILAELDLI
ncbi:MAG: response regulator [Bacillota bacterium]|nr:response regulator [Bacillota bacterium]HHU29165.1 response regulator [Bacillota bacterium]